MATVTCEKLTEDEITSAILASAADLFSTNYGVWGPLAESKMGPFAKQGRRVRMSGLKLEEQCLPQAPCVHNTYVRATINGELVGNAFACRWLHEGRPVCWITQLVVNAAHRRQGLATRLLRKVREGEQDWRFGILSSHPAAILAALRAFGPGIEEVDLGVAREHACAIIRESPVTYVRMAKLHGSLFERGVTDGAVSSADSGFWVDHQEPLDTLKAIRDRGRVWPFGELVDGHEFLLLVKAEAEEWGVDGKSLDSTLSSDDKY
ncbi:hypothetical protein MMC17_000534 [Xylographa soralifera]|nr:hypothetical protein [Xylographa soralifera]